MPAETTKRKQGMCYNCDEPYVRGHRCTCLFCLKVSAFDRDDPLPEDVVASILDTVISLHAITSIRNEDIM